MKEDVNKFLDDKGRIKIWPTKRDKKALVLEYLAEKFEFEKNYSEKEVNSIIISWHTFEDYFLLRRELIEQKLLLRTKDGSSYWKASLKDKYIYKLDNNDEIIIRQFSNKDSISEITHLLHRAYKVLGDMGLKYLATHQSEEVTLNRIKEAYATFIAIYNNRIVGTISLYGPKYNDIGKWYSQSFVAKFGQFAVEPKLQKYGIGSKMLEIIEEKAKEIEGVTEIALDTAESAEHLIAYYSKKGYRDVELIKWDVTNYRSRVLSKKLS